MFVGRTAAMKPMLVCVIVVRDRVWYVTVLCTVQLHAKRCCRARVWGYCHCVNKVRATTKLKWVIRVHAKILETLFVEMGGKYCFLCFELSDDKYGTQLTIPRPSNSSGVVEIVGWGLGSEGIPLIIATHRLR